MLKILLIPIAILSGIAAVPDVACNGCLLDGSSGGPGAADFVFEWTANPNPNPNEEHGHGECEPNPGSTACLETDCKVNGDLSVTNNAGYQVKVVWKGESGGITVDPTETGDFTSGVVAIDCDKDKRIEIQKASTSEVRAWYDWDCTRCTKTVIPD